MNDVGGRGLKKKQEKKQPKKCSRFGVVWGWLKKNEK